MIQYSQSTLDAAERFRAANDTLCSYYPVNADSPTAQVAAAVRAYDDAAHALAHLVLSDVDRQAEVNR